MKTTLDTIVSLLGFAGLMMLCADGEDAAWLIATKVAGFALIGAAYGFFRLTHKTARS